MMLSAAIFLSLYAQNSSIFFPASKVDIISVTTWPRAASQSKALSGGSGSPLKSVDTQCVSHRHHFLDIVLEHHTTPIISSICSGQLNRCWTSAVHISSHLSMACHASKCATSWIRSTLTYIAFTRSICRVWIQWWTNHLLLDVITVLSQKQLRTFFKRLPKPFTTN